jgi:iron-sulfur cluster assembly protein
VVNLTESAIDYLKEVVEPEDYVRIGVVGGGCAGFSYVLEIEEAFEKDDVVVELDGVKLCLDPKSSFMLEKTTVDYEQTLTQSGFKFINPSAKSTCGCGSSFNCA